MPEISPMSILSLLSSVSVAHHCNLLRPVIRIEIQYFFMQKLYLIKNQQNPKETTAHRGVKVGSLWVVIPV